MFHPPGGSAEMLRTMQTFCKARAFVPILPTFRGAAQIGSPLRGSTADNRNWLEPVLQLWQVVQSETERANSVPHSIELNFGEWCLWARAAI